MLRTYTASEARKNFGEILNIVVYGEEPVAIKRRGKIIVLITTPPERKKNLVEKYAGAWGTRSLKPLEKSMKKFRKDFEFIKT